MQLRNRTAIVTGASRGLGVVIAEALAAQGVHLALAARSAEDLETTVSKVEARGVRAVAVPTDVTDKDALENLIRTTEDHLGRVDILVNNAGVEHYQPYQEYDFDMIEKIMTTNLLSAQWLTRLALPAMLGRGRGHIVNIASVAGKTPVPYNAIYSASKHGLVGFSWSLREELHGTGVGVSVVCPGFVADSGMFAGWSKGEKPPGLTSTVRPEKVGEATVAAIEKNKGEVIVGPPAMKLTKMIPHGVSGAIGRRVGAYRFLETSAVPAFRKDSDAH